MDADRKELEAKQNRATRHEQRTWLRNDQSQSTPDPTPADAAAAMMGGDSSMFLSSDEETDEALLRHFHRARYAGASDVAVGALLGATPSAPGSGESPVRHIATPQEWAKVYDPIQVIIREIVVGTSESSSTQRHLGRALMALNAIVKKQNGRGGPALEDVLKEATKIRRQRYEVRADERERARLEDAVGALPKEAKRSAAAVDDAFEDRGEGGLFLGSHVGGAVLIPADSNAGTDNAILNAIGQSAELVPTPRPRDPRENAARIAGDEPGTGELTATMRAMVDSIEQLTVRIDALVQIRHTEYDANGALFRSATLDSDLERELDEDDGMSMDNFQNFNSVGH